MAKQPQKKSAGNKKNPVLRKLDYRWPALIAVVAFAPKVSGVVGKRSANGTVYTGDVLAAYDGQGKPLSPSGATGVTIGFDGKAELVR